MKKLILVILVQGMLLLPLALTAQSGGTHPVTGVWKCMTERPALVGGTIRFDIINKTASFNWQGRGQLSYAIESVDFDDRVGFRRYFLSLRGSAGTMAITVIVLDDSTIYIGQTVRGGIAIWGGYTRQS